jgi:hypothetical protein
LDRVIANGPRRAVSPGLSAAHQAILADFGDPARDDGQEDLMGQVLFGRTGLMDGEQPENRYGNQGNNPKTFY